ncbi:hypothetical protein CQ046_07700 [Chryseobacterium sp. MYb7]|uniref:hypothetical protein n=1 Tax=Chryseobacterium sp. MYb7 TaxID=1827290 RepID=UPI000CFE54D8|nr:hypothetical protein [Chryseobacterium sp. MYb7]PRB04101.1 hypothetical protein CQ046_07700 [Chryseobacterium sp. MYb7]
MEVIFNQLKDVQWKKVNIIFNINGGAIGYDKIEYIDEYGTTNSFWIKFKLIDNLLNLINNQYNQSLNDVSKRFNKYQIEIFSDGKTIENKWWDSEKDKQDLLKGAEVVFQWANDRMMSMIFEFEKENNLLPTQYDADDELEYLSSWDSGVFTFHINDKNELEYEIVLTKDGVERVLEMSLKDYFIEGILEHHQITNTELSDEWKPWNTLIIKSPHNSIPYDKVDEFVSYILE